MTLLELFRKSNRVYVVYPDTIYPDGSLHDVYWYEDTSVTLLDSSVTDIIGVYTKDDEDQVGEFDSNTIVNPNDKGIVVIDGVTLKFTAEIPINQTFLTQRALGVYNV